MESGVDPLQLVTMVALLLLFRAGGLAPSELRALVGQLS